VNVRRVARITGTALVVGGVLALIWVGVVWRWQDPFTALYTHWKQHQLAKSYEKRFAAYTPLQRLDRGASATATMRSIAREARRYRLDSHRGEAIGRIVVRRLGLNMILVNGTDHDSLKKGPGRDLRTYMPGEGQLIYIAGHRTTYLAPFAHIDAIRAGDAIEIELPYATFVYRATKHRIVAASDLSVLRSPKHEQLELQACHPRFFASHRYIVYAKLVRVEPRGGDAFSAVSTQAAARG